MARLVHDRRHGARRAPGRCRHRPPRLGGRLPRRRRCRPACLARRSCRHLGSGHRASRGAPAARDRRRLSRRCAQTTEPVSFSPGPWPGWSWITDASRKASCRDLSPSRRGPACWLPRSGAAAVISPARALISRRASSRSRCSAASGALGQAALDRGGAHQVDGGRGDHLDRRHLGDVAGGLLVTCRDGRFGRPSAGLGDSVLTLVALQIDRPCPSSGDLRG